ncbi:MAG TPA: GNAT family N-acetyltransferase [Ktedonobacterales bacterium]|nr:GNAT family N-acetyltransferase [Ktedonobacterales bacterium]
MITSPRIDIATVADIHGLAALRIQQKWWERGERLLRPLLAWDGGRLFTIHAGALDLPLADGTTPTTPIAVVGALAADATGVIGNVVVRADYQRRGLARLLMGAALEWQRAKGVRTVWLDATQDGRSLYRSVGFVDCEPSYYAEASVGALKRDWLRATSGALRGRMASADAIGCMASLDLAAFGGDRMPLLAGVLREPGTWLYLVEDAKGDILGYLMARTLESPLVGLRLGAWVARSDEAAAALLAALVAEDAPWRIAVARAPNGSQPPALHISPPGNNPAALALLKNAGVDIVLDDLIMRHDFPDADGTIHPARQRVEWLYGWLAAMVF